MRFLILLGLSLFTTTAFADGPALTNTGVSVLDLITTMFRNYMKFMTGSFAPFAAVIAGTAAIGFFMFNAKEGLMATILKWVAGAIAVLAVPPAIVWLQSAL